MIELKAGKIVWHQGKQILHNDGVSARGVWVSAIHG